MNKHDIAKVLSEMATILEVNGENPFKVRAYENAARIVEGLNDLETRIENGLLTEIRGIGENLAEHITELYRTGKIKEHERLRKSMPSGIFNILAIPGVGPKTVNYLWKKMHVDDLGELELICKHGTLRKRKGFGQKTETKILQGIAYLRRNTGQHLYSNAFVAAQEVYEQLKKHPSVIRLEIAGSLRRKKEIIKDIDMVASSKRPSELMDFFTTLPQVEEIEAKGDTKSAVMLASGISCDLRVVADAEFPYALHHFTGSKEHNIAMRGRAMIMGMKMNEYGLFRVTGAASHPERPRACRGGVEGSPTEKLIPCKDETDIFAKLGLAFIPPEMREEMGEIEAAEKGEIPCLIEEKDISGILHVHTNCSDGLNTVEQMALGAKKLGYSYIGICDHSQSAAYAGGLKPADVKKQWQEIDGLNKKLKGITILKGIESDILSDGSLDYSDGILAGFDFVIASVHSKFNLAEDEMTDRVIKAISNRYVKILGHPTGRLLLSRDAYKINMHRVIDAAAEHDVAIELNANPHRLDLDWRLMPYARSKGVKIAICPDAHSVENMADMMFGVGIARKGWMTKNDVINAWGLEKIRKFFKYEK